jgi:hypothetical protein
MVSVGHDFMNIAEFSAIMRRYSCDLGISSCKVYPLNFSAIAKVGKVCELINICQ